MNSICFEKTASADAIERRGEGRREERERRQHSPWVADLNDPRSGLDRRQTPERRAARNEPFKAR